MAKNDEALYELTTVENPRYVSTMRDNPGSAAGFNYSHSSLSNTNTSNAGKTSRQSNCNKVVIGLAVATCCSILLALCSLAIAAYAVADMQTRMDNMASMLSDSSLTSADARRQSLQQLYQDVNTTQSQVRVLADEVSRLTTAQSTISDMIMEINNVSRGPPGENLQSIESI